MKANAPDKIYVHEASAPELTEKLPYYIEYTRTDAFIDKACKFISDRVDISFNVECSNGEPLAGSYSEYAIARLEAANKIIDEFKNYMKGE